MALPAVNGNTIFASDLYAIGQPSGGQDKGHYRIAGNGSAVNAVISTWIVAMSHNTGAAPVSVSIDTADQAPGGNLGSPSAVNSNSGGVLIFGTISAASTNAFCAGNYTINY